MRIGILSYNLPHLKTEQVIMGLSLCDKYEIEVYCLPFTQRKEREVEFEHRPYQFNTAHPRDLAHFHHLSFNEIKTVDEIKNPPEINLVTVGLIIDDSLLKKSKVINCHAGLIPAVRGLDAFKWAIFNMDPLGVTLHIIDSEIDKGEHLFSQKTPIFRDDTIETLARRHYEMEVNLLINFEKYMLNPHPPLPGLTERPSQMRMPKENELMMIETFSMYVEKYATHG